VSVQKVVKREGAGLDEVSVRLTKEKKLKTKKRTRKKNLEKGERTKRTISLGAGRQKEVREGSKKGRKKVEPHPEGSATERRKKVKVKSFNMHRRIKRVPAQLN